MRTIGAICASLTVAGCASVDHTVVPYHPYPAGSMDSQDPDVIAKRKTVRQDNEDADAKLTGVRYYRSAYYLLVYTDGKGGLVWQMSPMADQTQLCVATPNQFLAKATSNVVLTNGMLGTSHSETDSTALMKSVIGALEKSIPYAMLDKDVAKPAPTVPAPLLFKVVPSPSRSDEWTLIGDPCAQEVHVIVRKE